MPTSRVSRIMGRHGYAMGVDIGLWEGVCASEQRVTSQSLSPQGFSLISLQFSLYNFRIFRYVSKDFGRVSGGFGWLAGRAKGCCFANWYCLLSKSISNAWDLSLPSHSEKEQTILVVRKRRVCTLGNDYSDFNFNRIMENWI